MRMQVVEGSHGVELFLLLLCGNERNAESEAGPGLAIDDMVAEGAGFAGFAAGDLIRGRTVPTWSRSLT